MPLGFERSGGDYAGPTMPREVETVRLGVRVCRWCRQLYTYPIGADNPSSGCPRCAPPLPGLERK